MKIEDNVNIRGNLLATNVLADTYSNVITSNGDTIVNIDFSTNKRQILSLQDLGVNLSINFSNCETNILDGYTLVISQDDTVERLIAFNVNVIHAVNLTIPISEKRMFKIEYDGTNYFLFGIQETDIGTSYTENTDYTSTNIISDGDAYTESLSLLDNFVSRLIPETPNKINTIGIDLINSGYSCKKISDGTLVNDVVFDNTVSFEGDNTFWDIESGNLESILDDITLFTLPLTENDDTNITNALLRISSNVDINSFSSVLDINSTLGSTQLPASETQHTLKFKTSTDGLVSGSKTFYRDDLLTSTIPNNGSLHTITDNLTKINGIPTLTSSNDVIVDVTINNCISNFYNTIIGKINSNVIDQYSIVSPSAPLTNGQTHQAVETLSILNNVFSQDTEFSAYGLRANGSQTPTLSGIKLSSGNVITDSVTDVSKFSITHDVSMKDTNYLMNQNGIIQYPEQTNWSNWNVGGGTFVDVDYSTLSNERFVEWQFNVVNSGTIILNLLNSTGFTNIIENDSLYRLTMTWGGYTLDGNAAYPGVGVIGDPTLTNCLVVGDSTTTKKILTFGEIKSGLVSVKLYLKPTSNKSFSQDSTLTQGNA